VSSPWCYTMDPEVRWQKCDVPLCGKTLIIVLLFSYSILILSVVVFIILFIYTHDYR